MNDREHRVRDIAHRLWEEEGRPAHQEKRHWEAAERIVEAQDRSSGGTSARDLGGGEPEQPQPPPPEKSADAPKRRAARKTAPKTGAKRPEK
jgi:Protein of unknown function (DUF2934)